MRIRCFAPLLSPGHTVWVDKKLSSQALSTCMFLFFFHLFFIIQKKGQGKERKKVKGHWRSREIEAD